MTGAGFRQEGFWGVTPCAWLRSPSRPRRFPSNDELPPNPEGAEALNPLPLIPRFPGYPPPSMCRPDKFGG